MSGLMRNGDGTEESYEPVPERIQVVVDRNDPDYHDGSCGLENIDVGPAVCWKYRLHLDLVHRAMSHPKRRAMETGRKWLEM